MYTAAVLFGMLAFPAWILAIPPMVWQFSQHNIAAGSLILWVILMNFFNSINSLIWPRDNIEQWWDGKVWCDIHTRLQVGAMVALAAAVTMIMRKLAKVMDTRNITVASSRNSMIKEKILEIFWCWGYPALMVAVYYIISPIRYFIFGIVGCTSAYDSSWPSIVLGFMWGPITMCFASFYSGLLLFRLYVYRREFSRLIAARDTTKSRFMRLFIMSLIIIVVYLPYQFYLMYCLVSQISAGYDWNKVHGPLWSKIIRVPSGGQVKFDKWGQIATGYLAFIVFGTGTEAINTYKRILCSIGLGKIFPGLHERRGRGATATSSGTFVHTWRSTLSSKAKSLFSKNSSITETLPDSTQNSMSPPPTPSIKLAGSLHPVSTEEPMLQRNDPQHTVSNGAMSFIGRIFIHRNRQQSTLPSFSQGSTGNTLDSEKLPTETVPSGISSRAWASGDLSTTRENDTGGVHVVREVQVHQAHQVNEDKEKEKHEELWARKFP